MKTGTIDLNTCDREPIHLIGSVQPHGALIAVDKQTLTVDYASLNTDRFLGIAAADILGRHLAEVIGEANVAELSRMQLLPSTPELLKPWFLAFEPAGDAPRRLECLAHRNAGSIILEFVNASESPAAVWEEEILRQRIISELIKPNALNELAQVSAEIIREVTGFDRVMIYRFAEDKHGEVIAESTTRDDSFLGLHYPASDIPDPARRHFTLNVMRSIPDINAEPVPIIKRGGGFADADAAQPLDLTYAKLRGVAPVHIEYLNNMGVKGSLSISLITNKELWGLVACHNYSPRYISSSRLRFAELLGGTVSALLQSIENTNQLRKSISAEKIAYTIEQDARGGTSLLDILDQRAHTLMEVMTATGLVFVRQGKVVEHGQVPVPPLDYRAMKARVIDGIATTSHLSALVDMDDEQRQAAAGAALVELSEDGADFVVFLRPNFEQTINWAGKPEKIEKRLEDGTFRLSPRGSFELWREERIGKSRPFDALDSDAVRILRRALFAVNSLERAHAALEAQRVAEAAETRLRHELLDVARTTSMGELASAIAHELNQPLAAIANYVNACRQEFRNAGVAIPERAAELIDEAVTESSRAGDLVRRMRNFISGGQLNADYVDINESIKQGIDLVMVSQELPRLRLIMLLDKSLPKIWADPVQIGQVVLNLARNSIAAMEGLENQTLTLETQRVGDYVEVSVKDTGRGIPKELESNLFEPFHASTTSGMGIGLSLCRSIVEAHAGRIWAKSAPNGAEVIFKLPVREGTDGSTD
ncbi:ATP-binding protein [Rhodobium gokarnense]|uniref:histidine kinase n=1 Tax=Rhodobium gokarnense TaxID=364296 RepID=A0ABT3HBP1_9HYPH|nr:ATP-binding protein [Rhodobium gokarnense]MCW2307800.1 light-regulated signal transduction histidine kinase (bacteriophytochrome) [Rhodobium gokarnense]